MWENFSHSLCPQFKDGLGEVSWSLTISQVGAEVPVLTTPNSNLYVLHLPAPFPPIITPLPLPCTVPGSSVQHSSLKLQL